MKPRLLDLFCGAGGAAMGYHRAGFEVVGVDNKPQPHYPFEFIISDALHVMDNLLRGAPLFRKSGEYYLSDFDAYHASPPCQKWTGLQDINRKRYGDTKNHPDLIDAIRQRFIPLDKPWVIENVTKSPLKTMIILCGASLGLRNLQRHRHFESNVMMFQPKCSHTKEQQIYGVYGKLDGRVVFKRKEYRATYAAKNIEHARELMQIDWMENGEIQEAIPPAYTEYIGGQLIKYIIR